MRNCSHSTIVKCSVSFCGIRALFNLISTLVHWVSCVLELNHLLFTLLILNQLVQFALSALKSWTFLSALTAEKPATTAFAAEATFSSPCLCSLTLILETLWQSERCRTMWTSSPGVRRQRLREAKVKLKLSLFSTLGKWCAKGLAPRSSLCCLFLWTETILNRQDYSRLLYF